MEKEINQNLTDDQLHDLILNRFDGAKEGVLNLPDKKVKVLLKSKRNLNFMIDANRSPVLPDLNWMMGVKDPELESLRRSQYNIQTDVEEWFYDGQKGNGLTTCGVMYEHAKKKDALTLFLSLRDGLAIQAAGPDFFDKLMELFPDKEEILLMGTCVMARHGGPRFASIGKNNQEVIIYWHNWWDRRPRPKSLILCFKHYYKRRK